MHLNEHDLTFELWALPWWAAGLATLLFGFGVFVLANYRIYQHNRHNGKVGISRFRQVILGDSLLLPAIVVLISLFYNETTDSTDTWLGSGWIPVGAFFASGLISFIWVQTAMNHPVGDWTTTPNGINLYGLYHFVFHWSQSYIWLLFGVLGFGYLLTQGGEWVLWVYLLSAASLMFIHVVVLGLLLDATSVPNWPWSAEKARSPGRLM